MVSGMPNVMKGTYDPCDILDEEDRIVRSAMRTWVESNLSETRREIDEDWDKHEIVDDLLEELLIDLTYQLAYLPEEYGGVGWESMVRGCVALEEAARGDSGLAVALACNTWAITPFAFGPWDNEPVLEWLGDFLTKGEPHLGCFAMTEPQGGSDIENSKMEGRTIRTTAKLDEDEWVINGEKQWPTNSHADYYLVVCTTDPEMGEEGIALIEVPGDSDGISVGEPEHKAGMAADYNSSIYFDNVRVPKEYRVAGPGEDAKAFNMTLAVGCLGSAAMSIGSARNAFEIVTDYASDRVVGGKPLKEHSIAAGTLADMATKIELARTYTLTSAYEFDNADYEHRWSEEMIAKTRLAKVFAARIATEVTGEAMHMMGSNGYTRDYDVEKHWRDIKETQIWLGGEFMNKLDIARYFCDLEEL